MKGLSRCLRHETVGEAADNLAAGWEGVHWLDSEKPEQARDEDYRLLVLSQAECVQLRRIVRIFSESKGSKYK